MMQERLSASQEWRRYWAVVLAAAAGYSFLAFMNTAIGLFMEPLQREFGWGRSLISTGPAIAAAFGLILSPLIGVFIDRFGSRKLALPGLILTALSIAAFSQQTQSVALWFALWALYSVCAMAICAVTWTNAVASTFAQSRGLAIGLTLTGSAVAIMIAPPLAEWLIRTQGWREAFIWLGLGWGGVAFILCWFFFFDPGDRLAASGRTPSEQLAARSRLPGLTIEDARRSTALLRVAIATLLILTVTVGVNVHQVPILVGIGVSQANAALLAGLSGLAGIAGKLITGLLLDRYHVRWVGGITLASTAIAYPLFMEMVTSVEFVTLAIIISGYAGGTKLQLCSYLTLSYGGIRNYGKIFGFMASMTYLSAGLGPILAGACYDGFGNYTLFLILGSVVSIISGLLIFSLGKYPDWPSEQPDLDTITCRAAGQ